jgi:proline racemase
VRFSKVFNVVGRHVGGPARGRRSAWARPSCESLIGSRFTSVVESLTTICDSPAVVPSVAGQAWITDVSQVGLDPTDPFPLGYTLADSWMKAPCLVR